MDLMSVLGKNYPRVEAHAIGYPVIYENIVWDGGEPLPSEEELLEAHLLHHKNHKIDELSAACNLDIISNGFHSAALGYDCVYDSQAIDQLNLVGSFLSCMPDSINPTGTQTYYAVRIVNPDGSLQAKSYVLHDSAVLKKVIMDGVAFKLTKLQRFNEMRANILTNFELTLDDLDAIQW